MTGTVEWTPKALKRLQPGERKPGKLGQPKSLWKKATGKWKSEPWQRGLGLATPSLRRATQAAFLCLNKSGETEIQPAVLFALLGSPLSLLEYWVAQGEGEKALEAVVEASFLSEGDFGGRLFLHRTERTPFAGDEFSEEKHWTALRKLMLGCPEETYQACLKWVRENRGSLDITRRCALSYVFPECPEWAAEDARELIQNPPSNQWSSWVPETAWLVLYSLRDLDLMAELCGSQPYLPNWAPWAILGQAQEQALRVLKPRLESASDYAADQVKAMFEAVTLISTLEVAEFLVPMLKAKLPKAARASVADYFARNPGLALRVLPGGGGEAEGIVSALVRSDPERARSLLDELNPSARASLESLLKKLGPVRPAASSEQIPDLLARPPWRSKAKIKKGQVVKEVEPLEFESRMDWRGRPVPRAYFYDRPPKRSDAKTVEQHLARLRKEKSLNIFEIDRAVDEAALTFLEEAPSKVWSIYQDHLLPLPARFETRAVPGLISLGNRRVDLAAEAISYIVCPSVAPFMAACLEKKKASALAQSWFELYPEAAAVGLIPLAVGPHGKQRDLNEQALRRLPPDIVRSTAKRYGKKVEAAVEEILSQDPLLLFPKKLPSLPDFAQAGSLPPLLTRDGSALPDSAVEEFLTMLAFSSPDQPYAGIERLRTELKEDSLEQFCWELFQAWLRAGAESKQQWAFLALAHYGGDEAARQLTPLIRKWPGESAHQRAVTGLDVLGGIGTDVALMNLHGIAQKLRFKALQARAQERIDEIAARRGLTLEELADRLVPDLGLNSQGRMELDFGPRQFEVRLDEQLRPQVYSEGKGIKTLPKPGAKDDSEKASQAVKAFKGLKKDCKQIARAQVTRLERAMTFRRRWSTEDFRTFLVDQPLVFELARRLLWGVYEEEALATTFRVAEDRTYADVEDNQVSLTPGQVIGVPHAMELDESVGKAWEEVFSDYELLQPFPQLSRQVHRLSAADGKLIKYTRFEDLVVPFSALLRLEERGWNKGEAWDGGVVAQFEKPLGEDLAELTFEPGLYLGAIRESGEQTLHCLTVLAPNRENKRKLGEVDPILMSELILDLEGLS